MINPGAQPASIISHSRPALAAKREELRAKGVETTASSIMDGPSRSTSGIPTARRLNIAAGRGNPLEDDAAMRGEFTVPRAALELNKTLAETRSDQGKRRA